MFQYNDVDVDVMNPATGPYIKMLKPRPVPRPRAPRARGEVSFPSDFFPLPTSCWLWVVQSSVDSRSLWLPIICLRRSSTCSLFSFLFLYPRSHSNFSCFQQRHQAEAHADVVASRRPFSQPLLRKSKAHHPYSHRPSDSSRRPPNCPSSCYITARSAQLLHEFSVCFRSLFICTHSLVPIFHIFFRYLDV